MVLNGVESVYVGDHQVSRHFGEICLSLFIFTSFFTGDILVTRQNKIDFFSKFRTSPNQITNFRGYLRCHSTPWYQSVSRDLA